MGKGEVHKKHHYVPKCYLNQFGHSNGKVKNEKFGLFVYNIEKNSQYTQSTEDVCYKNYLYFLSKEYIDKLSDTQINELSLECDYLAGYVEYNLDIILSELKRRKEICICDKARTFPMQNNDKELIAKQIIIQYFRHPNIRKDILSLDHYITTKASRLFKYGLSKELNNPEINKIHLDVKQFEVETHAYHSFLNDKLVNELATKLVADNWMFVYSQNNEICTSDNPVVCLGKTFEGRLSKCNLDLNTKIVLYAISPDLLLLIFDKNSFTCSDLTFGEITDECFEIYHNALFKNSNYIFCYNNKFEYFKKLNNG